MIIDYYRKLEYIIRPVVALFAAAALAAGCATEPDPLDRTQPEAIPKAIFAGDWYYVLTVTDADWDNRITFIGEQSNTYMGKPIKVRWEITKDKLNAFMLPQAYRDKTGKLVVNTVGQKSLIVSFSIKKQYDIRYRYNSTTREELNIIEENTDRPWKDREYMEVDWSRSLATNIWAPTGMEVASGTITREDVATYENVEFFSRGADRDQDTLIDTRQWNAKSDPEVHAINIDTKESMTSKLKSAMQLYYGYYMEPTTVRFRHSFLKATPAQQVTYKPMELRDEMFRRFGFFRTEYEVYDYDRHVPTETQKKYYINRWDLSPGKYLTWYLSPSTQEAINAGDKDLLTWIGEVVKAYNKTFQAATGRTDAIITVKQNTPLTDSDGAQVTLADGTKRWVYELGDLRFPMINIVTKQGPAQPGGYGPSMPDPDSGEIIHGAVNIYGGWLEWVVQRALDQYDVAVGNCTIDEMKNGRYYDPKTRRCDAGEKGSVTSGPKNNKSVPSSYGLFPGGTAKGQAHAGFLSPALKTAHYPKGEITKGMPAGLAAELASLQTKLKSVYDWENKHPTKVDLNGFSTVAKSKLESRLLPSNNIYSLMPYAQNTTETDVVAELSPATRLSATNLPAFKNQMTAAMMLRDEPAAFEPAIHAYVQEMKGKSRSEVEKTLRRWIYYTVIMHEMGHTLGLRHNFSGSADRRNFPAAFSAAYKTYWDKVDALRTTYQASIQKGDAKAYEDYVSKVDEIPSVHDRYATSSIMEYVGDWMNWSNEVRPYDHAALLLGYGNKVEVKNDKTGKWEFQTYRTGDFEATDPLDEKTAAKSGRKVRYYLFCSDEKIFDEAFCTPFDRGTTATEIVRNFIRESQESYLFRNFKRDRTMFDGARRGYYMRKWLMQYYMHAKPFAQLTLNSLRYSEFWSSIFTGINNMIYGPEKKEMKPGYYRDGGEDLLRASLLYYYYLMFDVLMRPDYGYFQQNVDTAGETYWENVKEKYLEQGKPTLFVEAGAGWGFSDTWDIQTDPQRYDVLLRRIGVELDKVIALEVLSIPMALNAPLSYEKANGNSFWNSLWTNNGVQLWNVMRGLIADNFSHQQNPWCIKCDSACMADPKKVPPALKVYPVDPLEGLGSSGLFTSYPLPTGKNRCGKDEYPVQPAMDALFAIKPIFFSIAGASHPWYHNALTEILDSQVKGGTHRFDIPTGGATVEFTNASGTKTYQAVQTTDELSISYALIDNGRKIKNRIDLAVACLEGKDTTGLTGTIGTNNRTCTEIKQCYATGAPSWCDTEGWDAGFQIKAIRYRDLDRIEAMLIMMQDMIDIAGHYSWRVPGFLNGGD